VAKLHVALIRERTANRLADHRLIINQQNSQSVFRRGSNGARGGGNGLVHCHSLFLLPASWSLGPLITGHHSILACIFRFIQSAVRELNQLWEGTLVLWDYRRTADTDCDVLTHGGRAVRNMQIFHIAQQPFAQRGKRSQRRQGKDDDELLASKARGEIGRSSKTHLHRGCDTLEHLVSCKVTIGIVVELKIVHVDHEDGQSALLAKGQLPLSFDIFIEVSSVT